MKLSIQNKILVGVLCSVLSIGIAISIIVSLRVEKLLFAGEKRSLQNSNLDGAKHISHVFDLATLFTKMLATRIRVVEYLQNPTQLRRDELVTIFDTYQKDYPQYLSIYLLDATGSALISTDRSFIGNNYSFRPYFKAAIKGKSYVDVALGKTSNQLGYYFAHPVLNSLNVPLGVMAVKFNPLMFPNELLRSHQENQTTPMIVNREGVILFSTKKERELKSLGPLSDSTKKRIIQQRTFLNSTIKPLSFTEVQSSIVEYSQPVTVEMTDQKNNNRSIITINRIGSYPFYLVTEVELNSIYAQIYDISRVLGLGIIGAACISVLVVLFIVRKVLAPLQTLKNHSKRLGNNNFSEEIAIHTNDELQELGDVLNHMQDNLRNSYDQLEHKVAVKTSQLSKQLAETEETKKAMFNLLEDVSKQKEKIEQHAVELQKFQLAVENVHDHIVITNPDGVILFANKAVEAITGYTSQEVLGKKAGDKNLWGGNMDQDTYQAFWHKIKVDKVAFVGEFTNKRKSGLPYIAEAQVSPILDEKGNVLFFVGIERDITKAKEVDRMKTEFLSLASHQLRTPLSAMKWFLEMLLNGDAGPLNPEQTEFTKNIDDSNNRMIELVNSLLNVSRIESGRIIVEPVPTNLKQLVQDVVKEIQVQLEGRKQHIILDIHHDLPLILLDQKLMRQVYINLLTNAIKYSPNGSDINMFISKENNTIITQISDSGYGIPHAEQDRIFSKFYRATNAIKKETEGNGLGLYLVKSIIESSKGKIWFTSSEERGTSFFFSIPIQGMKQHQGEVRLS